MDRRAVLCLRKVKDSRYHHDAVDGGGDKAKNAQTEQEMKHRDTSSPDS